MRLMDSLGEFVGWIVDRVVHRPILTTCVAVAAFILCGYAYLQLEPRYRLADQVPDREQAWRPQAGSTKSSPAPVPCTS